jgi:dienelactone hydrolase
MEFVLTVPDAGTVSEHADFDLYLPKDTEGPRPAVVIVPGTSPAAYPVRPRHWPLFIGYARLLASRGMAAAIVDVTFHQPSEWEPASKVLPGIVESVRGHAEVDADRIALWATSGGALLVGGWLAESPPWLRCLALSYPMLGETAPNPGRPIVLTQVGLEDPQLQKTVDQFLARAAETGTSVDVINVPNGHHGFDIADHTDESRQAVLAATDYVVANLAR